MDNKEFEDFINDAKNLAKICEAVDACLDGLSHTAKVTVLSSVMQHEISNGDHEFEDNVIAEMAYVMARMIVTYKIANGALPDMEDEDSEEFEMPKDRPQ